MKRFRSSLKEYATNIIDFEKKENATVNKKTAKITTKRKSMLHLRKKIYKKSLLKIKTIVKLETIAIILINTEARHMYVI